MEVDAIVEQRVAQAGEQPVLTTDCAGSVLVDRKSSPGVFWFGSGETPIGEFGAAPVFDDAICARAAP